MDELLFDTSYLLPVFGLGLGLKGFETNFPVVLGRYSALYNPASLVEAKWIVLRMARDRPESKEALLSAYRTGLKVLASEPRLKQTLLTDDSVEEVADWLLGREGLKDYFDRLVYATAARRGCSLVTEDERLREIARRNRTKPKSVMKWSELLRSLH